MDVACREMQWPQQASLCLGITVSSFKMKQVANKLFSVMKQPYRPSHHSAQQACFDHNAKSKAESGCSSQASSVLPVHSLRCTPVSRDVAKQISRCTRSQDNGELCDLCNILQEENNTSLSAIGAIATGGSGKGNNCSCPPWLGCQSVFR